MMSNEETISAAILKAASLLGNGDANTPMGAIEAYGKQSGESLDRIAYSLDNIATAITYLADVINDK